MASLPSPRYLTPMEIDVTLSIESDSINDDSSSIIIGATLDRSASSSPKRSGLQNLRREGYSEEKCRYVLVKYCSSIPRNFNYADGLQLVYEKLREHCGDENLDLSIGVLYEFIEVDTQYTFEQGAAFRRWQYDHFRRASDLTNCHAPRMGNIIVGNIIPTEKLRQWRLQHPEQQRGVKLSDSDNAKPGSRCSMTSVPLHFGIMHRSAWHIENSLYVSSLKEGTRVLYCPSPQELHERAWNEAFGRGGKLVQKTHDVGPETGIAIDAEENDNVDEPSKSKSHDVFLLSLLGSVSYIHRIRLARKPSAIPPYFRVKCAHIFGRGKSISVIEHEGLQEVLNLPDVDSEEGKAYYSNIKTLELPKGVEIPNSTFARKHDLVHQDYSLGSQISFLQNCMGSVEELAIRKCIEANLEAEKTGKRWTYRGPLTASLFKDGGIDYQWEVPHPPTKSYIQSSAEAYLSSHDGPIGNIDALNAPAASARRQRARSLSRRALQGGDDIQHDSVEWTVGENARDATRLYAAWRRDDIDSSPFSPVEICSSEDLEEDNVAAASGSNFDRFAAGLQGKLVTTPRAARPRALERTVYRPEASGIRKRTAESVLARKQLLKKIVTFDGVNEMEEKDERSSLVEHKANNNNNSRSNNNVNNPKLLETKHRTRLATSVLRSSFLRKFSSAIEYHIAALAGKVAEHKDGMGGKIAENGVFLLKSPQPLNIRKASAESNRARTQENSHQESSHSRLDSTAEEPETPRGRAPTYPPRTSSHRKDTAKMRKANKHREIPESNAADDEFDDSFMGNFIAVEKPQTSMPFATSRTMGRSREGAMQAAAAHYAKHVHNPYEFEDSPDPSRLTHVTTVTDFLNSSFGSSTSATSQAAERQFMHDQSSAPASARKNHGHVKNSSVDANGKYMDARRKVHINESEHHGSFRAEYHDGEATRRNGLYRIQSSPAIGVNPDPIPSDNITPYAAYETFEGDSRYSGPNPETGSYHYSGSSRGSHGGTTTTTSSERGRSQAAKGLGIDSLQFQELTEGGERVQVVKEPEPEPKPSPKRSRSPMKKLFGPGGFLGNTGRANSPADARYVKHQNKPSVVSKIKTKIEEFAEVQRSRSPVRNVLKSEEKVTAPTKHPISLSPPRQAKLYMELELLICATTNHFLMDQFRGGRMSPESIKKIAEFWKNKGRPQVIEFQYDQATQRDLIVANQKDFQFHGDNAGNPLHVNAMLYSWKQNAREMAVRTFCTPDTVIQKQLHDTYRMLELLGAGVPTFVILQDIHKDFNKQVKRAYEAREKREAMKKMHSSERVVVLPQAPNTAFIPSPPLEAKNNAFADAPKGRPAEFRTHLRSKSEIPKTPEFLHASRMNDPYHAAPIVKRGPYADQSEILDEYHSSQASSKANKSTATLTSGSRARAHTESRQEQNVHHANMSFNSQASEYSKYDNENGKTYSAQATESRHNPHPQDSFNSYYSQTGNSQFRPEDSLGNVGPMHSQTHATRLGRSDSYSAQVANARIPPDQRSSGDSYPPRSSPSRASDNRQATVQSVPSEYHDSWVTEYAQSHYDDYGKAL